MIINYLGIQTHKSPWYDFEAHADCSIQLTLSHVPEWCPTV